MGVLSDRQIIATPGMITPLSPGVKREGKISYGVTSYGMDCRVGYVFRVFSPVGCTVIDPKAFDPAALVTVDLTPKGHDLAWRVTSHRDPRYWECVNCGVRYQETSEEDHLISIGKYQELGACPKVPQPPDHILIPPNSFALAETVETFDIPRNCVGLVVGKSTYARCFSGATRVILMDGSEPSFSEMVENPESPRWGFGVDPATGEYRATELKAPRWVSRETLVRVTLDDGTTIDCTPDHKFLRHGGTYTEAQDLNPGDGLVPLYRKVFRGRNMVWIPKLGNWLPAHWLADNWNLRHSIYPPTPKTHRHHIDGNRRNDNPPNIERKEISRHIKDHNAVYYGEGFDPALHGFLIREALSERSKDPAWVEAVRLANSAKGRRLWDAPKFAAQRAKILEALRNSWNEERAEAARNRIKAVNSRYTAERRSAGWTDERRKKQAEVMRRVNKVRYGGNHSVVSVKPLRGLHDVYCLTSADTGNFALSNGVVTKNCGLVVNCTPLEPEWRGRLTVELSNTAPLPIKVYCNEGIFQLMFHRSDEISSMLAATSPHWPKLFEGMGCGTSYKDKQGRYQEQTGITLPKVD